MYLVKDTANATYVFVEEDPHFDQGAAETNGCVVEEVRLHRVEAPGDWTPGVAESNLYLGRSPIASGEYRVFNSDVDCEIAGFEKLGTKFKSVRTWDQYLAQRA